MRPFSQEFGKLKRLKPIHDLISIPALEVENVEGLDTTTTSARIAEWYFASLTENFSLLLPISQTLIDAAQYCLTVRYGVGYEVVRYKVWGDIGEVLDYPIYAGQTILADNVVFEAWTINETETDIDAIGFTLLMGQTTPQTDVAGNAFTTYEPSQTVLA
jgi:hypothetical protein